MALYKLSDGNTIIAEEDFINSVYPDAVRLPDPPVDPKAAILAELDTLQTLSPRTMFDLARGDKSHVERIALKVDVLRKQLEDLK